MKADERAELSFKLRQLFKPGTPINRDDLSWGGRPRHAN